MQLRMNDSLLIWPGEETQRPQGYMLPTHLRVLTIEEAPFVFVRRVEHLSECRTYDEEEPCPHYNTTDDGNQSCNNEIFTNVLFHLADFIYTARPTMFCCRGYCIDLLKKLSSTMNFTSELALSPDGQFGSFVSKNGTSKF
jgi:ionotropic glutamate receptor NMDA 1